MPAYGIVDGRPSPPSDPQARFHRAAATCDRVFFLAGLGAGKSWSGAVHTVRAILWNRAQLEARRSGKNVNKFRRIELLHLVGAPSYQLIDAGPWAHVLAILDQIEAVNGFSLLAAAPRKTHPREIRLVTGDVIKFVSTDAGRYAGANAASWWLDEAEESDDPIGAYHLLDNRCRDPISPRRWGIVTSTPGVDGRGLLEVWRDRISAGDTSYSIVEGRTDSNPALAGTGYYERLRSTMSAAEIEARLHGRPMPPSSTVFGRDFGDRNIARAWTWRGVRKDREYLLGVDWGGHYAGILIERDPVADVDAVIDEVMIDGVQDHEFLDLVLAMLRRRGLDRLDISKMWCDPNPKDSCRLAYSKRYFPGRVNFRRTDERRKKAGLATVRWRLNPADGPPKLVIAPHLRHGHRRGIYASLKNYQWKERRVGGEIQTLARVNQESPYSHACDALRYLLHGLHRDARIRAMSAVA